MCLRLRTGHAPGLRAVRTEIPGDTTAATPYRAEPDPELTSHRTQLGGGGSDEERDRNRGIPISWTAVAVIHSTKSNPLGWTRPPSSDGEKVNYPRLRRSSGVAKRQTVLVEGLDTGSQRDACWFCAIHPEKRYVVCQLRCSTSPSRHPRKPRRLLPFPSGPESDAAVVAPCRTGYGLARPPGDDRDWPEAEPLDRLQLEFSSGREPALRRDERGHAPVASRVPAVTHSNPRPSSRGTIIATASTVGCRLCPSSMLLGGTPSCSPTMTPACACWTTNVVM